MLACESGKKLAMKGTQSCRCELALCCLGFLFLATLITSGALTVFWIGTLYPAKHVLSFRGVSEALYGHFDYPSVASSKDALALEVERALYFYIDAYRTVTQLHILLGEIMQLCFQVGLLLLILNLISCFCLGY